MYKGNDGVWRTAGGIPVSAAQAAELDRKPATGVELRDDKMVTINGKTYKMEYAQYGDEYVATCVRLQMRHHVDHEQVCIMGRERITYLAELVAEAREMLAQVGGGYPPSRPMSSAPLDGTWVLLSGPEGHATCRWRSGATNNPVVMALQGDAAGYWQCYGSAMAFRNPARWWPLPETI